MDIGHAFVFCIDVYVKEKLPMSRRPGSSATPPDPATVPAERLAVARLIQTWLTGPAHTLTLLEETSGISRQSLSSILNCKVTIAPDTCKKLADALDISAETLLTAAGYIPPPATPPVKSALLAGYIRWVGLLRDEQQAELETFFRTAFAAMAPGADAPIVRPPYARPFLPDVAPEDTGDA